MIHIKQRKNNEIKVVDLFCGAGIGAMGLKLCGFNIIYGVDNNKYAVETYNNNIGNHAICESIRNIEASSIPDHDVMVATPVCKSFSVAGNGKGVKDKKNGDLSYHFFRLLKEKLPKVFLFENVSGMVSKKHRCFFDNFINDLESIGYNVSWKLVNCADYGIPQDRKRVFVIGVRKDINKKFTFPQEVDADKKTCLRDAIFDIKNIKNIKNNEYFEGGYSPRYKSRNRQRQWDQQSFTIVSEARQLPLYPEPPNYDIRKMEEYEVDPPRRFTVRECLRIQTAPDEFYFGNNVPLLKQYERCSGIPTLMAYKLGIEIEKVLLSKINT